jgi:hypothetical protein
MSAFWPSLSKASLKKMMLSLLRISNFAMASENVSSRSSQNSMYQPAMVLRLAPARGYEFKHSPSSFSTLQHMFRISPQKNIVSMSCLLSGLFCLKWDGQGPTLSLLCLHKKMYHCYVKSPDHLRPRYESSMVTMLASAKGYKVSCASSLLSPHNTSSKVLLKKWNKDVECLLWPFSPQKYRLLAAYVEFLAGPKKKLHPRHMESLHYLKLHYGPGMVPVLAPEK